ncbi:hypothetical protein CPC16_003921, partial [Podila verticillata]
MPVAMHHTNKNVDMYAGPGPLPLQGQIREMARRHSQPYMVIHNNINLTHHPNQENTSTTIARVKRTPEDRERLKQLFHEHEILKTTIAELQQHNADTQSQMLSLQQQVAYFQEQATVQHNNYQAAKASSDMFEQRNNDLFIELEAAQGTMKTLLDDKTSEITIGTLEGTVAELRNEVANLQSHSVYLNTSNKAQEITYNALAHDHRRLKETVKTLKTKGTELDNGALFEAIEDTKTKAAAVYAQNTELCQMLATLQASHSTLENTTALLASRNSEMSELLLRANADVAALRGGTSQLREMVENSDAKGANLQKHNHHLSEHVRKLEVDAANLKRRYDSLVNELEIAKAVTREKKILESRLQIIKVNSDFLDSKNKDLVAENASVNKNLDITH